MLVVHGSWADDRLALWAEDSSGHNPGATRARVRPHPFAASASSLADDLPLWGDAATTALGRAVADELVLLLPSSATEPAALSRIRGGGHRAAAEDQLMAGARPAGRARRGTEPARLRRRDGPSPRRGARARRALGRRSLGTDPGCLPAVSRHRREVRPRPGPSRPGAPSTRRREREPRGAVASRADRPLRRPLPRPRRRGASRLPRRRRGAALGPRADRGPDRPDRRGGAAEAPRSPARRTPAGTSRPRHGPLDGRPNRGNRRDSRSDTSRGGRAGRAAAGVVQVGAPARRSRQGVFPPVRPRLRPGLRPRRLSSDLDLAFDPGLRPHTGPGHGPGGGLAAEYGGHPARPRDDSRWRVEFAVQSAEDPSLSLSAGLLWAGETAPGLPPAPRRRCWRGSAVRYGCSRAGRGAARCRSRRSSSLDTAGAFTIPASGRARCSRRPGSACSCRAWAGRKRGWG